MNAWQEVIAGGRRWAVELGNCLDLLALMPTASVDAVVTDPPYELGFMNKGWDASGIAFSVPMWREVLRVMKPGAYLLACGGSRTAHRMVCAIEDAGAEIRDSLPWLYGTGFPKSLDVAKAMDRKRDDSDDVLVVTQWLNAEIKRAGVKTPAILAHFGFNEGSGQVGHWTALSHGGQPAVPTWEQWCELKTLIGLGEDMDGEVWRLNGRKGKPGELWGQREAVGFKTGNVGDLFKPGEGVSKTGVFEVTRAAGDDAKRWEGWGTALRPAHEPICLARKPLIGTVAANVLEHGTGALNIGACKLPGDRWPPNVMLDELTAAELDDLVGEPVARYFYVPKPDRDERDLGLEDMAAVSGGEATDRKDGSAGLKSPRAGAGRGGGRKNYHPTVKPVALMQHLVRLITQPGGVVLDPFTGSGGTGAAAMLEGFRFVGCDLTPGYVEIASRRITRAELMARHTSSAELATEIDHRQVSIFDLLEGT